jgi:hypothetical protein
MDHVKPVGMDSAGKPEIFSKVLEKPAQSYALVLDKKILHLFVFLVQTAKTRSTCSIFEGTLIS